MPTKKTSGSEPYRVKDRSAKVAKRRRRMPVNGKSVFVILATIAKKARATQRHE